MKKEKNILKNYLLYFSTLLLTCIIGISNIFADTVALGTQYVSGQMCDSSNTCEWLENTNFYNGILISNSSNSRRPKTFGWNFNMNASTNTTYTARFTLAFYYDYNFNLSGYWYFKDYIQGANVQFGELNGNVKTISCSTSALERSTSSKSDKITVTCIFTPKESGSRYYFLGVTNTNYANYGYVPFGSGTSFTVESNTIDGSTDNSGVIINQNQTIINQNQQQIQQQQEIINNQNQNTQDIIDSNKVCTTYNKDNIVSDGFLGDTGNLVTTTEYGLTDYLDILNKSVKIVNPLNSSSNFCFYNSSKSLISCVRNNTLSSGDQLTIPSNSNYIRATINKSQNLPQFQICQNGNQALDDSISNLDDTLKDDDTSDAENEASEFFSSFDTETFGLTSIITTPLTLIQSILSSTCTTLRLPLPYLSNKYLELPCMSSIYSEFFGPFFTIYQTITYGIIAYWVCVRIFNQVKDFKNPEHDEIEVMDL